jgi:hypothetical protein
MRRKKLYRILPKLILVIHGQWRVLSTSEIRLAIGI